MPEHTEIYKGHTIIIMQDDCGTSPDEWKDTDIFLVHYHRQFQVTNDLVEKDDLVDLFRGASLDKDHYLNEFYVFFTRAYIHSGISLSIGGPFAFDPGGWDTSRCGAILVKKITINGWDQEDKARKAAEGLCQEWNDYLSGNVWGYVIERDGEGAKNSVDYIVKRDRAEHCKRLKGWIKRKVALIYRQPMPYQGR
jgi:hypothetical protein